jgi:hypothetical protein
MDLQERGREILQCDVNENPGCEDKVERVVLEGQIQDMTVDRGHLRPGLPRQPQRVAVRLHAHDLDGGANDLGHRRQVVPPVAPNLEDP